MGIFDPFFRKSERLSTFDASPFISTTPVVSAGADSFPVSLLPEMDSPTLPVSEAEALSVPAVHRAVQIYTSVVSRLPLHNAPFITGKARGAMTPAWTIASCLRDLMLNGASLLEVERDAAGFVTLAKRVHPYRWRLTQDGAGILVDQKPASTDRFVYVPSLMPYGLAYAARDSIRHYLHIARTINARVANPNPTQIITPNVDFEATEEEIEKFLDDYAKALTSTRGGIVYKPRGIDILPFDAGGATDLYIGARNAVRTDVANFFGLPAALLDGQQSGSSETYTNALQRASELLELSLKTYSEPLADRLSADDVTPPGTRVFFDYTEFDQRLTDTNGNTLPRGRDDRQQGRVVDPENQEEVSHDPDEG